MLTVTLENGVVLLATLKDGKLMPVRYVRRGAADLKVEELRREGVECRVGASCPYGIIIERGLTSSGRSVC